MTLIIHTGGTSGAVNQYVDLRLKGSNEWRGLPKFGAPATDLVNEANELLASVANIYPGGGAANQGVDCYEVNYPPYYGDVTLLGQRLDAGGAANDGTYVAAGAGAHPCGQFLLVYWNASLSDAWTVPAHRMRVNRTVEGLIQPWIPAMIIPPASRRVLFVMADTTVIEGSSEMSPARGPDDFPLYVPDDDNVWCSPLEFNYSGQTNPGEASYQACKRLQHQLGERINTVLYTRMNLDREIVCGVPGRDGAVFAMLEYPFPQGDPADMFAKVAMEARSVEYDGTSEPGPWVPLTPITGAGEFIDATGKVTPPGDTKVFTVKFLLALSLLPAAPPELELRFKRIARHVDDNADYLDFLGGGYMAWFASPFMGTGLP